MEGRRYDTLYFPSWIYTWLVIPRARDSPSLISVSLRYQLRHICWNRLQRCIRGCLSSHRSYSQWHCAWFWWMRLWVTHRNAFTVGLPRIFLLLLYYYIIFYSGRANEANYGLSPIKRHNLPLARKKSLSVRPSFSQTSANDTWQFQPASKPAFLQLIHESWSIRKDIPSFSAKTRLLNSFSLEKYTNRTHRFSSWSTSWTAWGIT